jgi:hypothetical protein
MDLAVAADQRAAAVEHQRRVVAASRIGIPDDGAANESHAGSSGRVRENATALPVWRLGVLLPRRRRRRRPGVQRQLGEQDQVRAKGPRLRQPRHQPAFAVGREEYFAHERDAHGVGHRFHVNQPAAAA